MCLNGAVLAELAVPAELISVIGAHDEAHQWSARPFSRSSRDAFEGVLDVEKARGHSSWVIWPDETIPVLAVVEDRLPWAHMSVAADRNPFLAVARAVAALDASGLTGVDTRPIGRESYFASSTPQSQIQ